MLVRYSICYHDCIMIMGAYSVGKAHNMLPWWYYDNWSILCRQDTHYATSEVI